MNLAKSATVVEYADDISAVKEDPAPTNVLNIKLNHLIVKLLAQLAGAVEYTKCIFAEG